MSEESRWKMVEVGWFWVEI